MIKCIAWNALVKVDTTLHAIIFSITPNVMKIIQQCLKISEIVMKIK